MGPEIFEVVTPREEIASHRETRKIVLIYEEESGIRNPDDEILFPKS